MSLIKAERFQLIETSAIIWIEGHGTFYYVNPGYYSCHNTISTVQDKLQIAYTTSNNTYKAKMLHISTDLSFPQTNSAYIAKFGVKYDLTIKSIYDWKFDAVEIEKALRKGLK